MPIRTILVPTDFSVHSHAALERAVELATALSARIQLLHSYWIAISLAPQGMMIPQDFTERLREAARSEMEQFAKRAPLASVTYDVQISASPATDAILEVAESLPADLIVMGTHGHTGLKHMLLGSTAERIVRLAPCPVMTVKAISAS